MSKMTEQRYLISDSKTHSLKSTFPLGEGAHGSSSVEPTNPRFTGKSLEPPALAGQRLA